MDTTDLGVKTLSIASSRRDFQREIQAASAILPDEARRCLDAMLRSLHKLALANAAESMRRSKYVMFAYWRVTAVYARHFRRYLKMMP